LSCQCKAKFWFRKALFAASNASSSFDEFRAA
jgi:hypothetical protein